jgi:subfamily B ATP-binding cassette protein MsbA
MLRAILPTYTGDLLPAKPRSTLLGLIKPHKAALVLALLVSLGEGAADLLSPWPLKVVIDAVAKPRDLPAWIGWATAYAGGDKLAVVRFAALATLAISAAGALCSYLQKRSITTVGQWVTHDLRKTLYSHVQRLSLAFHDNSHTGDLISRVTSDIDSIQSFITSGLLDSVVNCLTLIGMVAIMVRIDWRFTLIAMSVAPILFTVAFTYTRRIKKTSREVRKKEGEIVSLIQEVLSSIHVVKAFATEDYEQNRLEEQSLESVEMGLRARGLKARLAPMVQTIVGCGTALVLWYGATRVIEGSLSPGSLVLFLAYLSKMYKPMQDLSKTTDAWSKAAVGFERIEEILKTEKEIRDLPNAKRASRLRGLIELEHVHFAYNPDREVLKDLNIRIEPGQRAALVGPTGAGKTSIAGLIPRFYDPVSGMVRIDGNDVRSYRQKSLREQISFVLQDNVLFSAPIWRNIAYGKPGAARADILRAAEMANAAEFIEQMPQGYDTVVGERGATLSGGQRQRIAIARAIIRDTPILILDEPTSGLDAGSEKLVFEALDRLMAKRTSIVIAHRLATIRNADVIFVISDGAVVETGRHDELVEKGGLYAELCRLQFATEPA